MKYFLFAENKSKDFTIMNISKKEKFIPNYI